MVFMRNRYLRNMRLKSGKNQETLKKDRQAEFKSKLEKSVFALTLFIKLETICNQPLSLMYSTKNYISHLTVALLL